MESLLQTGDTPNIDKITGYLTSPAFIISCIVFVLAFVIFFILGHRKKKTTKTIEKLKDPKTTFIRRLLLGGQAVTLLAGFVIICQINGVNLVSLVAGLGIAGAVVGLAFQDYLKDIIMGFHILSDRFFAIGDCVEINGKEGVVVGFSLTTTKLEALTDRSGFTICNRNITEVKKLNGIVLLDIPLPYDEDAEKIHNLLTEASKRITKMKEVKKCDFCGTQNFDDSAILYRFSIHCNDTKRYIVRRAVLFEIQKILKEQNIAVPFNQLDVHLDGERAEK